MESGDGLLLRVRPRAARLSAEALRAVADVSRTCGNGTVDLTRRANLQIRGVRDATLSAALSILSDAGLLDGDERDEAVRNILVSPLAGLDTAGAFDAAAIATALEGRLVADPAFGDLPVKFSFLIDEGGRLPLIDVPADIRIEADGRSARLLIGGDGRTAIPVALVEPGEAADAATTLARAFLRLERRPRSMRALAEAGDATALAYAAGLPPAPLTNAKARLPAARCPIFGAQRGFLGVGAAFGSFTSDELGAIADEAVTDVRLTPWRALLLPGADARTAVRLGALGLVTEERDPRLAIAACPGRPACLSGEADSRSLARALAASLPGAVEAGVALHVSGCAKGCAHSAPAPFTLVGNEGRFDLVLDGTARDTAVLTGLNAAQAERALRIAADQALAS